MYNHVPFCMVPTITTFLCIHLSYDKALTAILRYENTSNLMDAIAEMCTESLDSATHCFSVANFDCLHVYNVFCNLHTQ